MPLFLTFQGGFLPSCILAEVSSIKAKYPVEFFDLFKSRLHWFIVQSYQVNPSETMGWIFPEEDLSHCSLFFKWALVLYCLIRVLPWKMLSR